MSSDEVFQEGQDVYFIHPVESWAKGVVKEVAHTKMKSGLMEVSYTCQGTAEKTLLPTVVGQGAIVSKLPASSLHQVVFTGAQGEEGGSADPKAVTFFPDGRDTFSDLLDPSYLHDSTLLEQVRKRYFDSPIVSGDSGAGKIETAKIVVKYLGKVSTSACSESVREVATQVTDRVNLTSPILGLW